MIEHWAADAVFYHIYPLGACGAPLRNDFGSPLAPRLASLFDDLDRWQGLGVTALYLGPVFESSAHGYDTADYYRVDRRLGDEALLKNFVAECHARGIKVILDGVFNHVGRDFWAFADLKRHGQGSPFVDWFRGVRFGAQSPFGDAFTYEGWQGCMDLVRLRLEHPAVREHLLAAVGQWMDAFDIDGLRLDVADELEVGFVRELVRFCKAKRPDFWLLGEMIHGDYRRIVNAEMLDSATNYACYKGLWSSLNDGNYFEIAHSLERHFGAGGIYRGLPLYAFVDNHDVNRVASKLGEKALLYPFYILLLTMPGIPSIYYGSEWGIEGKKANGSDAQLRPVLDIQTIQTHAPQPDLPETLCRLASIRKTRRRSFLGPIHNCLLHRSNLLFYAR